MNTTLDDGSSRPLDAAPPTPWRDPVQHPEPLTDAGTHWQLRRRCALTPRQLMVAFGSLWALNLPVGAVFWALGYPWVAFFVMLELFACAFALLYYMHHARDGETLSLQQGRLVVEQHCGAAVHRSEFHSAWVRVQGGQAGGLIMLAQNKQRLCVGQYLQPQQRAPLAHELRVALLQTRPAD